MNLIPFEPPEGREPFLLFVLFWNAFIGWLGYVFLKLPVEIVVTDTQKVVLRNPVRTTFLEPGPITRIACDTEGEWILRHTMERVVFRYFRWVELKSFFERVLSVNPRVSAPDELA